MRIFRPCFPAPERVNLVNEKGHFLLVRYPEKKFSDNVLAEIEVAFPVVHGTNVEDGTLQGYLKTIGVPFVGCDVWRKRYRYGQIRYQSRFEAV